MKPVHLKICGWGPYKEESVIDFDEFDGRGLFLITGSTGAGKTTIFDAITYALYGNVSGSMREKDSVRSDFAEPLVKTFVELIMSHQGNTYTIVRNPRYLRPKLRKAGTAEYTEEKENAKLVLPDGRIIEGIQEVNRKIQEILVLDYRQFKQISMIAQGEFARLLTADAKEKMQIFREIFGTGIYDIFAGILRRKSSDLYNEIQEFAHKIQEDIHFIDLKEDGFTELTEVKSYHLESIIDYVKEAHVRYLGDEKKIQAAVKALEDRVSEKETILTNAKRDNELLDQLVSYECKLDELSKDKNHMEEKRIALANGKKASEVLKIETKLEQLQDKKQALLEEAKQCKAEIETCHERQRELYDRYQNRSFLEQYITNLEEYQTMEQSVRSRVNSLDEKKSKKEIGQQDYLDQEKKALNKKAIFEEADKTYKRASVGIVARMLQEGEPCPVCGSLEHPKVATVTEEIPSEELVEQYKTDYENADKQQQIIYQNLMLLQGEILKEEEFLEQEKCKFVEKEAYFLGVSKEKAFLEVLQQCKIVTLSQFSEWDNRKQLVALTEWKNHIRRAMEEYHRLDGLIAEKQATLDKNADAQELWKNMDEDAREEFQNSLEQYRFLSKEEYDNSKRTYHELEEMEASLQQYDRELQAIQNFMENNRTLAKGKQKVELQDLQEEILALKTEKENKNNQLKAIHVLCDRLQKGSRSMEDKKEKIEVKSAEYGIWKDLDQIVSGNNPRRLVFEQYVLASYFEEILQAANQRFCKMTGGRFELFRVDGVQDGRRKDNLEMEVMDYYTGKMRSVRTLSGGESFKASLSLALGMSDVIQGNSGGIQVDTLFIDEGFGSLDAESLDHACEVLQSLVDSNRMIGIISHVPELRERIDNQIVVQKTNTGSTILVKH